MLLKRPRRNRRSPSIRSLVEESFLRPSDLVAPFFVLPGEKRRDPIKSLPGISRLSADYILKEASYLHEKGVVAISLFPVIPIEEKTLDARAALDPNGVIPKTVRLLKQELPSLCVITDIALDPFTTHGHDGITDGEDILNDPTVEVLAQMALVHAESGADYVAPSDMMDGRIGAIRKALDAHACEHVGIIAYSVKYASHLYHPFRDALSSSLHFGDKKTYQMNPANVREALLEARLDEEEGADVLMVKPALFYLDVIAKLRANTKLPICAFHVSGEYAMVLAAHEKNFLNAESVFLEALLSIKRAGADFIFTYATPMMVDFF